MADSAVYEASPIKRNRATRDEMAERAEFLIAYAAEQNPVTVRQLYYRAEITHLPGIDKEEGSYNKIQRQVLLLRRAGELPYENIADLTRWMRKPTTYDSIEAALQETARFYRKALWRDAEVYVEVWCEKDALAGVIYPVTEKYDVPLMVARGFSSETFCFEAIENAAEQDKPYIVYYLGDFDRAGQQAANALREKLERFAAEREVEVEFVHLAIGEDDVSEYDGDTVRIHFMLDEHEFDRRLSTRLHKRTSRADQLWLYPYACELDAIEPDDLRDLVRWAIEMHLPADQLALLHIVEASEREQIQGLVARLADEKAAEDAECQQELEQGIEEERSQPAPDEPEKPPRLILRRPTE
jgi:hypothetical protein